METAREGKGSGDRAWGMSEQVGVRRGLWRDLEEEPLPALCPAMKFLSVTTLFPQFPHLAKE